MVVSLLCEPADAQLQSTIRALNERFPDRTFRFVFGADAYLAMPSWRGGQELQQRLAMLIIPRAGVEVDLPPNAQQMSLHGVEFISSTEVRRRVGLQQPIGNLVCRSVQDYIYDCGLYSTQHVK